jgi:hypothetical protein
MGSLSNLYISQSYQSLTHFGNDSSASTSLVELQDGLGNGLGVSVNTNGDLSLTNASKCSLCGVFSVAAILTIGTLSLTNLSK